LRVHRDHESGDKQRKEYEGSYKEEAMDAARTKKMMMMKSRNNSELKNKIAFERLLDDCVYAV